ncbi:MAG: hypothetical protein KZQ86_10420, partial [Candidatus Thiodiazotropha sp. (ex Lucinoma kastoroae)]|nr:hypothetical protein [Candidatus Thiodiazotropha sp. (ex Lucinoma kastoroae)]
MFPSRYLEPIQRQPCRLASVWRALFVAVLVTLMLLVGGCSTGKSNRPGKQDGVSRHHPPPPNMDTISDAVPKVEA